MKTVQLIEKLFEYDERVGLYHLPTWMFNEIIKRLEEPEELRRVVRVYQKYDKTMKEIDKTD